MNKILGIGALTLGLVSASFAADRIGPVSQYGQLQVGKNAAGKGRIYGSCPAYSTSGNEVAVQGMSLFWSMTKSAGIDFWNGNVIKSLVEKHKIQLVRAPMGVDGSWEDDVGNYYTNPMHKTAMNAVVQAAIDNDIYVLIDYHSHCAEKNTNGAAAFFEEMAQKWGKYDNVIFEIYNEPKNGDCDWSGWYDADGAKDYWKRAIYPYANTVISAIRKHSDNLIVVGTPYYDQYVDAALVQPINDKNVAYTFHYYAGEDPYRHKVDVLGKNPEALMNKGYSVFVTEWGNSAPSGDGGFTSSYSTQWYNWMKTNQLSGANWSVSNKAETASYFTTDVSAETPSSQWSYTESGSWTNQNVFAGLPSSYKACDGSVVPSSSSVAKSSSSVASSSSAKSSSSVKNPQSSSSSWPASSSATVAGNLSVDGSLVQTVAKKSEFGTITIDGISNYTRETYNAYFLTFGVAGGKLVIAGTIPEYFNEEKVTEKFNVNGQSMQIELTIVPEGTVIPSSSSVKPKSSSSTDALVASGVAKFSMAMSGRTLIIAGAPGADVDVFDMQGRPLERFRNVQNASLETLPSGSYLIHVRVGSAHMAKRMVLK